jgi:hypothetical protein
MKRDDGEQSVLNFSFMIIKAGKSKIIKTASELNFFSLVKYFVVLKKTVLLV